MPKQLPRSPLDFDPQIVDVRGERVMLDETLAELYGVPTKVFNQAVRRNRDRFPSDFLLEVDAKEWEILRSQIVTLRIGHGRHRKYLPLAFTEHGAIMAAMILNSPRAIQMSVYVVRAFIRFRKALATHKELASELDALKRSVSTLDAGTRRQFDQVYEAILGLMAAPVRKVQAEDHADDVIRNWLRNRNRVEFLGVWERLNNPGFNPVEFDGIRIEALFGQTAKQWREANPELDGNMRDHGTIEQLLVLANIEGMNAEFIHMKLPQGDRLKRLNAIAIRQMHTLTLGSGALRTLQGT